MERKPFSATDSLPSFQWCEMAICTHMIYLHCMAFSHFKPCRLIPPQQLSGLGWKAVKWWSGEEMWSSGWAPWHLQNALKSTVHSEQRWCCIVQIVLLLQFGRFCPKGQTSLLYWTKVGGGKIFNLDWSPETDYENYSPVCKSFEFDCKSFELPVFFVLFYLIYVCCK